jgi:hypothetical protein
MALEPERSLELLEFASPLAGLAYDLPRKRPPPAAQPQPAPATKRSIAGQEKLR